MKTKSGQEFTLVENRDDQETQGAPSLRSLQGRATMLSVPWFVVPSGLHRTYGAHHLHFITWRVAQPFCSGFPSRSETQGAPSLRFLQGRAAMLSVLLVRHAQRSAPYLRRSSPALYHLLVLSAIALS